MAIKVFSFNSRIILEYNLTKMPQNCLHLCLSGNCNRSYAKMIIFSFFFSYSLFGFYDENFDEKKNNTILSFKEQEVTFLLLVPIKRKN